MIESLLATPRSESRYSESVSEGRPAYRAADSQPVHIENERILAAIRDSLRASQYLELQQLQITIRERQVVLTGAVPTFHLKQVAQAAVLRVDGVRAIVNDLHVTRYPAS